MIEVKVSYDRDPDYAREACTWWAAWRSRPEEKEGVGPDQMERLADANAERAPTRFHRLERPEEIAADIRRYVDLGFDELVLHAP